MKIDFSTILDDFIQNELDRKSLKDNYGTQVLLFFIVAPAIAGFIGTTFDFLTTFHIIKQSIPNPIFGTALGVLFGLVIAASIFIFITFGTVRSVKNFRIFFIDLQGDFQEAGWSLKDWTPKWKNLIYGVLIFVIAAAGLRSTLYLSNHADFLVKGMVAAPKVEQVQAQLAMIEQQEEERKQVKLRHTSTTLSRLDAQLSSKIAANTSANTWQSRIAKAKQDSTAAIAAQWRTINKKQDAIKAGGLSPTLLAGYQQDISYRKNTVIPSIETKYKKRITGYQTNYNNAIQGEKKWYSDQLGIINKKQDAITSKADSTTAWLTGLFKQETEETIKNIEFLAFFARGGNRYINLFVFICACIVGFMVIPDFGEYKPQKVSASTTHKTSTTAQDGKTGGRRTGGTIHYCDYEGTRVKVSQVNSWIKTYSKRMEDMEALMNSTDAEGEKEQCRVKIERYQAKVDTWREALKSTYWA